jgi:hypothetical protein
MINFTDRKDHNNINGLQYFPKAAKWIRVIAVFPLIFLLVSCQADPIESAVPVDDQGSGLEETGTSPITSGGGEPTVQEDQDQPQDQSQDEPLDPAVIQQNWESSSHASTFVEGVAGNNNTCARCHAPANWFPSIDDMPESCFACKFEVSDPPPYIAENDWQNVSCNICHQLDKKDNVEPGYIYLEVAAIEEYSDVATTTELCQKCHTAVDLPGHDVAELAGAHADYMCTECHDSHAAAALSCGSVGCHDDVIEPAVSIAGHDQDHQKVSCVACHDAAGMQVAFIEEMGVWTTIVSGSMETDQDIFALTSHNIVKESSCDRCHFENNPWNLSSTVSAP